MCGLNKSCARSVDRSVVVESSHRKLVGKVKDRKVGSGKEVFHRVLKLKSSESLQRGRIASGLDERIAACAEQWQAEK
jgi:hypothetical protein